MSQRSYTLIDFEVPRALWPAPDRLVCFVEFVRQHFHEIVPAAPAECELDLLVSGHAHNTGSLPLLGLYVPPSVVQTLPDVFSMIEALSIWSSKLSPEEVEHIVASTDAPTWAQLQGVDAYPIRS